MESASGRPEGPPQAEGLPHRGVFITIGGLQAHPDRPGGLPHGYNRLHMHKSAALLLLTCCALHAAAIPRPEIGRASCRERGEVSRVLVSFRKRHTRCLSDWSSDLCSSDLYNRLHMHKSAALLLLTCCALHAAAIPRPEYPQSQFQRDRWLSLNGAWEFEFDDANAGLDADWASGSRKFSRNITVPYCFESRLSGIGDTSFHPWIWYRRAVPLPADWKGRRVLLHFGAVNYWSMVWVNGKLAGSHEGGNTPFTFDVTPLLQPGANVLTVRAHFPPTDRYIPRGKQFWEPKSKSIFYTRSSGIWQPVWMEPVGASYLDRVKITPAIAGAVRLEFAIARPQPDLEVTASASFVGQPAASATAHTSAARTAALLSIEN